MFFFYFIDQTQLQFVKYVMNKGVRGCIQFNTISLRRIMPAHHTYVCRISLEIKSPPLQRQFSFNNKVPSHPNFSYGVVVTLLPSKRLRIGLMTIQVVIKVKLYLIDPAKKPLWCMSYIELKWCWRQPWLADSNSVSDARIRWMDQNGRKCKKCMRMTKLPHLAIPI